MLQNTEISFNRTKPFVPSGDDPGYVLTCRAYTGENPRINLREEDRTPMDEEGAELWPTISDLDADSIVSLHEWITKRLT